MMSKPLNPEMHYVDMPAHFNIGIKNLRTSLEHSPSLSSPGLLLLSVMWLWPGSLQNLLRDVAHHAAAVPTGCGPQRGWWGRMTGAKSRFNHTPPSVMMKDTPAYKVTQNHISLVHMIRGLAVSRDLNAPWKICSLQQKWRASSVFVNSAETD